MRAQFAKRYLSDTDLHAGAKARLFNLPVFVQRQLARCGVHQTLDICTYEAPIFFSIGALPILANAIMAVRYPPSHYHRLWMRFQRTNKRENPKTKLRLSSGFDIGIAFFMVDWEYVYENSCGQ